MLTGEGINSDKKGDAKLMRHFSFAARFALRYSARNTREADPVDYRVTVRVNPLCCPQM
jgi:hypothetical protein